MLNTIRNVIALQLAGYAGEKLIQAGQAGFRAFKAARDNRGTTYRPVDLNAASEADIATLLPFRVTVALLTADGATGACTHDIYAVDANDATAWCWNRYGTEGNLRVIVEAIH
jgi:hypothetical protein